jgi:hypothetical protein
MSSTPALRLVRSRAPDSMDHLVEKQERILSRKQLRDLGYSFHDVERELRAGRWTAHGPTVVALHNGPLTPAQNRWRALLNAGSDAALCARTALEVDGLRGWEDPAVHVLFSKERGHRPCRASSPMSRGAMTPSSIDILSRYLGAPGPSDPLSTRPRGQGVHVPPVGSSPRSYSNASSHRIDW